MKKFYKIGLAFVLGVAISLTSVAAYSRWKGSYLRDSSVDIISEVRIKVGDMKNEINSLQSEVTTKSESSDKLQSDLEALDQLVEQISKERDEYIKDLETESKLREELSETYENVRERAVKAESDLEQAYKDFLEVEGLLQELLKEVNE